jgi:(R,R)-butanediol dehydrogenase / meso-butanediol dehydrogenase / diacetyl reductase
LTAESRVAVLSGPRKFDLVERERPTPREGEALIRIAATAVCHTDLDMYTGSNKAVRYPVVLGHESTGTVEAIASEGSGLAPGQTVLINPVITCGHCDSCKRGLEHLCRNAGLFGREIEGSLSEYVTLDTRYLYTLPEKLPFDDATIVETLATVRHAQQRAQLEAGESVVVLGQGTTGLLHTRLAALTGCDPVIAVSRTKWKLERAMAMGARHAVERDAKDAVQEVLRLTNGAGADVVIDTAGGADTMRAGIDMLRPGGRFCSFSLSHEPFAGVSAFPLYFKEVSIIGSRALTAADIKASIDLVAAGKIDVSGFVSNTYPLEAAAEAFKEYEGNPSRILRIIIDSRAG